MRIDADGDKAIAVATATADETRAVAAGLARELRGGEVLGLRGDLGAGKTVFVQGLACGLDSRDPVTSPSFVIIHEYHGRLRLHHVDLYRLGCEHVDDLGLDELIEPDALVAIEWSERLPERLRRLLTLEIVIECGAGESERRICICAPARAGAGRIRQLAEVLSRLTSLDAERPEA
jgi:tRNA threonylcarbamoyladenosine biosynthesis protein TsaE